MGCARLGVGEFFIFAFSISDYSIATVVAVCNIKACQAINLAKVSTTSAISASVVE